MHPHFKCLTESILEPDFIKKTWVNPIKMYIYEFPYLFSHRKSRERSRPFNMLVCVKSVYPFVSTHENMMKQLISLKKIKLKCLYLFWHLKIPTRSPFRKDISPNNSLGRTLFSVLWKVGVVKY